MLRIGINGLGRIGRAILRANLDKRMFKIVAVNDINTDDGNLAYTLNYDTLYDQLTDKFHASLGHLINTTEDLTVYHMAHIDEVDWDASGVDLVIDSSGVLDNVLRAKSVIAESRVKKVIVTHSPEEVDFSMVLGANHEDLDISKHDVISSSICDATALAPVMQLIEDKFGIEYGSVTTLHPVLNYQNLMDGAASSWSVPGTTYHHYALGRSAVGNMIPKPTTAVTATCKVLRGVPEETIGSFSYRTPTLIVGSADLTLALERSVSRDDVLTVFREFESEQEWQIIHNNMEPLVSLDFKKSPFSAVADHRWTDVIGNRMLKLVLWYDNEWGYASRVVDQISYVESQMVAGDFCQDEGLLKEEAGFFMGEC